MGTVRNALRGQSEECRPLSPSSFPATPMMVTPPGRPSRTRRRTLNRPSSTCTGCTRARGAPCHRPESINEMSILNPKARGNKTLFAALKCMALARLSSGGVKYLCRASWQGERGDFNLEALSLSRSPPPPRAPSTHIHIVLVSRSYLSALLGVPPRPPYRGLWRRSKWLLGTQTDVLVPDASGGGGLVMMLKEREKKR